MKLVPLTLAAILATAFSGTVLAEGEGGNTVSIGNETMISNDIAIEGGAEVSGDIPITSESKAILDNSQSVTGNTTQYVDTNNNASVSGGSGNGAEGNLGINVAAGSGNAQGNEAALSAIDAGLVFAAAQTFSTQDTSGNGVTTYYGVNNATIDSSLQGVKGNVGVNVAAGAGNLQDNQLAASVNTSGTLATATGSNQQTVTCNTVDDSSGFGSNNASIANGALAGGQGNIGANVAAGFGNLQHNSLSIAVAHN